MVEDHRGNLWIGTSKGLSRLDPHAMEFRNYSTMDGLPGNIFNQGSKNMLNGETSTYVRVADFLNTIPAVTGKVELVYEGEQEGAGHVAQVLMGKAIRTQFLKYFPDPDKGKKSKQGSPYKSITEWFGDGNTVDLLNDASEMDYKKAIQNVPGLKGLVEKYQPDAKGDEKLFLMEFALHGLAEHSQLSKNRLSTGLQFKDLLSGMFSMPSFSDEDEDDKY